MADKKEVQWVSYSWDELGEYADEIKELKARMCQSFAKDEGVDAARVRVAFSKLGCAFAVVEPTSVKPKKLLGQKEVVKPAKTFGPRSPRLK